MEGLTYLALIAAWALPVIVLEWLFGRETLRLEWRPLVATVVMATVYLGCADVVGTRNEIWSASPAKTIGLSAGGFVLEDWVLLLLTNTMIAQTVILLLDGGAAGRARRFFRRR